MSSKIEKRKRAESDSTLAVRSIERTTTYSGPIPPASEFEKYELVLSGAADRILAMTEKQSAHRIELERAVIMGGQKMQFRGWLSASIITITCILGGIFLIYKGKDITGFATIISALGGLIGVFVYGKNQGTQELAIKAK
ncbi:MAG: DUF2335 domain-containing protein [Candidatus Gracilibacteria bacterium]|nr:DUF2335 domain-containing protein [Candidatus Gracilibacteria bacterium]